MKVICKQPNGLYCRFDTELCCPTEWDFDEEYYINLCEEEGRSKEWAKANLKNNLKDFDYVLSFYKPKTMSIAVYKDFLSDCYYENN